MIGFEVVASVVLFVLLAVVTAMAIIGLLGAGGALAMAPCPECRHLGVIASTWRYCPYCGPGTVSRIAHARVLHPHLRPHARSRLHPHLSLHPHWPRLHRRR